MEEIQIIKIAQYLHNRYKREGLSAMEASVELLLPLETIYVYKANGSIIGYSIYDIARYIVQHT